MMGLKSHLLISLSTWSYTLMWLSGYRWWVQLPDAQKGNKSHFNHLRTEMTFCWQRLILLMKSSTVINRYHRWVINRITSYSKRLMKIKIVTLVQEIRFDVSVCIAISFTTDIRNRFYDGSAKLLPDSHYLHADILVKYKKLNY